MPRHKRLVAFDFSGLDHLHLGNGQFRYCVDLLHGLARLTTDFRFVVVGSRLQPPDEIREIFGADGWRYQRFPPWPVKGGAYLHHARFSWWMRRERVALLHAPHTFLPALSKVPAVVTIFDMMSELFPEYRERVISRPYQLFRRAVQRRQPFAIAISQTTADDVQRLWGLPSPRVRVVYLGIDPVRPPVGPDGLPRASSEKLAALAHQKFILSPYNLEPRKNLRPLLVAMATVRRTDPDLRLVLYGRAAITREREALFEQDLRNTGLEDAVVRTAFVSEYDLAFLLAHSELFVFPSLYEGFGLPVLEAMAAGVCTIARNRSAMAEVLDDTGVLIETKDPVLLASTIKGLLGDPGRRAALGSAAIARATLFSRDTMARGTVAAYWSALERQ